MVFKELIVTVKRTIWRLVVAVDFINTRRNVMNDFDLRRCRGLASIRWRCLDRVLARYF